MLPRMLFMGNKRGPTWAEARERLCRREQPLLRWHLQHAGHLHRGPGNEKNNANHCHGGLAGVDEWLSQPLNTVRSARRTMFLSGHARSTSLHRPRPFLYTLSVTCGRLPVSSGSLGSCPSHMDQAEDTYSFPISLLSNCCCLFSFITPPLPLQKKKKKESLCVSCFCITGYIFLSFETLLCWMTYYECVFLNKALVCYKKQKKKPRGLWHA